MKRPISTGSHKDLKEFLRHLKENDAAVARWPKWKRDAQGCKMGSHQDKGKKPRLKPTKGWAAPDRSGKADLFSMSPAEFNKHISVAVMVRDFRDDKEIQAKNRKLTAENKQLRSALLRCYRRLEKQKTSNNYETRYYAAIDHRKGTG